MVYLGCFFMVNVGKYTIRIHTFSWIVWEKCFEPVVLKKATPLTSVKTSNASKARPVESRN